MGYIFLVRLIILSKFRRLRTDIAPFLYRDGLEDPLGTSNTLRCMAPLGLSLVALQFCRCSSPLTSSTLPGQPLQVIQSLSGTFKPPLACLGTLLISLAQTTIFIVHHPAMMQHVFLHLTDCAAEMNMSRPAAPGPGGPWPPQGGRPPFGRHGAPQGRGFQGRVGPHSRGPEHGPSRGFGRRGNFPRVRINTCLLGDLQETTQIIPNGMPNS